MRVVFVIPLLVLPILHFAGAEDSILVPICIVTYFAFIVFLSLSVMVETGTGEGRMERLAR